MSDRNPDCEWVRERLDAFVDHELGDAGHAAVTAHCAHCGSCTLELEMAIRVRRMLRTLPAFEAPAHVIDAAERAIGSNATNVVALPGRRGVRTFRTAALVAAAVTLIGAGAWIGAREYRVRQEEASRAEVQKATAELALAFGYVGRYSDGVVRDDVFEKRVMPHIERAISRDSAKPQPKQTGM